MREKMIISRHIPPLASRGVLKPKIIRNISLKELCHLILIGGK